MVIILIIKFLLNKNHVLFNLITIEILNMSLFILISVYTIYINIVEFVLTFQVITLSSAALAISLLINLSGYTMSDKLSN